MLKHTSSFVATAAALLTAASLVSGVSACSVPVFRYALERWVPDPYHVFLFTRGPLQHEAKKVAELLDGKSLEKAKVANLVLHVVDLSGEVSEQFKKLWQAEKTDRLPWIVVRYPVWSGIPVPVWAGPPSEQVVRQLVDSPARQEIVKRVAGGDCAVWVFIESGNKKKDAVALKLLQTQLKKLEEELKLPPPDPFAAPPDQPAADVELKVTFSILKLARSDPAEKLFADMLLGTERDLRDYLGKEPIVFPVFGRARALYALVGDGINEENIVETCVFLIGDCSCQIKAMNPGTDLLVAADWDSLLFGQLSTAEPVPDLTGLSEFVPEPSEPDSGKQQSATASDEARQAEPAGDATPREAKAATPAGSEEQSASSNNAEPTGQQLATPAAGPTEPVSVLRAPPVAPARQSAARRSAAPASKGGPSNEAESYDLLAWTLGIATGLILLVVVVGTAIVLSRQS